MAMFGVSISSLLDSLDSVAKETLEEPKESATRIRSRRKLNDSRDNLRAKALEDANPDHDEEDTRPGSDAGSDSKKSADLPQPMEDASVHSNRTQESYVLPSSPTASAHDSEEQADRSSATVEADSEKSPLSSVSAPTASASAASASKGVKQRPPIPSTSTSSGSTAPVATDSAEITELRKALKKKSQEIESLNRECLELEEQCNSMKQEIQEAWDHYKLAQEKAALREAELQDELNQIQKAKQVDKQQSVTQIAKLTEDVESLIKQLQTLRDEKQELVHQVSQVDAIHASYNERIQALEEDLKEARMHSVQGAQTLREELQQLQRQHDHMRSENTQLLRQAQQRQIQLEKENADLAQAVAESQKEVQRLRNPDSTGTYAATGQSALSNISQDYFSREIVQLQQEVRQLQTELERQKELRQAAEIAQRRAEKDTRLLQLTNDEQRTRQQETEQRLQNTIRQLESQLQQFQQSGVRSDGQRSGFLGSSSVDAGDAGNENTTIKELQGQVEHLSKLLLKKQADVLDLQGDRTALRSKVGDLQGKCAALETQVQRLREQLEAVGEDADEDLEGGGVDSGDSSASPYRSRGGGLSHRRGRGLNDLHDGHSSSSVIPPSPKIIKDLEKIGVKPSAGVTKAVTMVDGLALVIGRFFRLYPLARVAFVMYLVLLHLWVFFILILHTHAMEMPSGPRDRVQNKLSRGLGP